MKKALLNPCKVLRKPLFLLLFVAGAVACVDNDYDWDDVNKDGIFNIPPVPFGNLDSIWLAAMPGNRPPIPPIENIDFRVTKSKTEEGLFDEELAKKFFFEGAEAVSLEGNIEISVPKLSDEMTLTIESKILDHNGDVLSDVEIQNQFFELKEDKSENLFEFKLTIPKEGIPYMNTARDIQFSFIFDLRGNITEGDLAELDSNSNFIYINQLVFKSGGVHISL